jgi:feruloyl-CoA synthase
MDGETAIQAPFRDARYAPRQMEVEHRAGGELVLTHPGRFDESHQTTPSALMQWARLQPTRNWLCERSGAGWRSVPYGEGAERVIALAFGLSELELPKDRPLLILSRNGVDHALMAYAAMSLGLAIAPVSPQYGLPGAEPARLARALEVLNPGGVYVEDAALFSAGLEAPGLAGLPVIAGRNPRKDDIGLDQLLRGGALAPSAQPTDIAKLLLTSGSTGLPKAVIQTHRNIAWNAAQIEACYQDPEPPVVVNAAPWSHSLGANAILQMVTHRGGTLYIDSGQPTAGAFGETLRNLAEIAPTYHNMVPAGWALLASALEEDEALARTFFSRVRVMQYGGANLAQSIADRLAAAAVRIAGERITIGSGYGATETGPTACNVHWHNDRAGLCGLPIPGTSAKLVPVGDKLEIRVKGPQISRGYYGQPELSAAAFDEEGFFRLGDAARPMEPGAPQRGLIFDGRLVENFKLATGAFVGAGQVRIEAVSAIGEAVLDAVVCGEGRAGVGLLLFANPKVSAADCAAAVREGLMRLNRQAGGSAARVARALVLDEPPHAASGEITDKGYINQALARARRASDVERLFADPPGPEVLVLT